MSEIPDGWIGVDIGPRDGAAPTREEARSAAHHLLERPDGRLRDRRLRARAPRPWRSAVAASRADHGGRRRRFARRGRTSSASRDRITHLSTGGGASLEYIEGLDAAGRRRAGALSAPPDPRRQLEDAQDRGRGRRSSSNAFLPLVRGRGATSRSSLAPPFTALAARRRGARRHAASRSRRRTCTRRSREPSPARSRRRMLAELGCRYAIVGHSERRTPVRRERRVRGAQGARRCSRRGIRPIVCVGETPRASARRAARSACSSASSPAASRASRLTRAEELVIAYEPIWAIGTGRTATPAIAQEVHAFVRELARRSASAPPRRAMRIQYGGSVKPDNVGGADGAARHRRRAGRRRQPRSRGASRASCASRAKEIPR